MQKPGTQLTLPAVSSLTTFSNQTIPSLLPHPPHTSRKTLVTDLTYSTLLSFVYLSLLKSTTSMSYPLTTTLFFWRPYVLRYHRPIQLQTTSLTEQNTKQSSQTYLNQLIDRPTTVSLVIRQLIIQPKTFNTRSKLAYLPLNIKSHPFLPPTT